MKVGKGNAYLTVYLALCLTLIISLCLTLIEGARRNGGRLEAECVAEVGMGSILAEYHRELMKQYNLFAVDSSYGTFSCGTAKVEERLKFYLEKNLSCEDLFLDRILYKDFFGLYPDEVELTRVSALTDFNGRIFRRAAADAMGDRVGLGLLQEIQQWMQMIEVNGMEDGQEEQKKQELDQEIASYDGKEIELKEGMTEIASVVNPTALIEERRRLGILKQIAPEDAFSQKMLVRDSLIENRLAAGEVNEGNMMSNAVQNGQALIERFLFQEYLLKYMGHYGQEKEDGALDYQMEYLIVGKAADIDNLRTIANRICVIREAANTMYLMSCGEKCAEVKLLSEVICSLITLPELAPLLEAAILLGWAYAESVYDVKALLAGEKIPLIKSDADWHYDLSAALAGDWDDGQQENKGMSYEDYLRVFMMLQDVEVLTVRAMNTVEADIRGTPGNQGFRLDACYVAVESHIVIGSRYGYRYNIICNKRY